MPGSGVAFPKKSLHRVQGLAEEPSPSLPVASQLYKGCTRAGFGFPPPMKLFLPSSSPGDATCPETLQGLKVALGGIELPREEICLLLLVPENLSPPLQCSCFAWRSSMIQAAGLGVQGTGRSHRAPASCRHRHSTLRFRAASSRPEHVHSCCLLFRDGGFFFFFSVMSYMATLCFTNLMLGSRSI